MGTSSAPCGLRRCQVQKPRERTGRRAACLAQPCGCACALVSCLPLNLKTPRLLGALLWGPEVSGRGCVGVEIAKICYLVLCKHKADQGTPVPCDEAKDHWRLAAGEQDTQGRCHLLELHP